MKKTCRDCGAAYEGSERSNYCIPCRRKRTGNRKKWFFTEAQDELIRKHYDPRVQGRVTDISEKLKMPRWVVSRRAKALGLICARTRKEWTKEEDDLLRESAGEKPVELIRKELGRSRNSVINRIKRLGLSRAVVYCGYTLRELEQCFGIGHHAIERWVAKGYMKKRLNDRNEWNISDTTILNFIICFPAEYDLRRVDQVWFKGLISDVDLLQEVLRTRVKRLQEVA